MWFGEHIPRLPKPLSCSRVQTAIRILQVPIASTESKKFGTQVNLTSMETFHVKEPIKGNNIFNGIIQSQNYSFKRWTA